MDLKFILRRCTKDDPDGTDAAANDPTVPAATDPASTDPASKVRWCRLKSGRPRSNRTRFQCLTLIHQNILEDIARAFFLWCYTKDVT
jgi:hypothetical protein